MAWLSLLAIFSCFPESRRRAAKKRPKVKDPTSRTLRPHWLIVPPAPLFSFAPSLSFCFPHIPLHFRWTDHPKMEWSLFCIPHLSHIRLTLFFAIFQTIYPYPFPGHQVLYIIITKMSRAQVKHLSVSILYSILCHLSASLSPHHFILPSSVRSSASFNPLPPGGLLISKIFSKHSFFLAYFYYPQAPITDPHYLVSNFLARSTANLAW